MASSEDGSESRYSLSEGENIDSADDGTYWSEDEGSTHYDSDSSIEEREGGGAMSGSERSRSSTSDDATASDAISDADENGANRASDEAFVKEFSTIAFENRIKTSSVFLEQLVPIRNNKRTFKELICNFQYREFSIAAWSKVGQLIGCNDHLLVLDVRFTSISNEKMGALLKGLKDNRSLRNIKFGKNIRGSDGIANLCSFLNQKKCILKELDLSFAELCSTNLSPFASSLKASNDVEVLNMFKSLPSEDEGRVNTFLGQLGWGSLRVLDVSCCNIGLEGCQALAELLQKSSCHLKRLEIRQNFIDDDCCSVLARSLQSNKWLKCLCLDDNSSISANGMEHFFDLVCDTQSIQHTNNSNSTLTELSWDGLRSLRSRTHFEQNIEQRIDDVLAINSRRSCLEKVFNAHFKNRNDFKSAMEYLLDFDVRLMPNILSCVGKKFNRFQSKKKNFRVLYHVVRYWNISVLCGFPSAQRVRLDSRLTQMESEIAQLKSKNEENDLLVEELRQKEHKLRVEKDSMEEKLRLEISKLRSEIELVKGKKLAQEQIIASCSHKRKREQ